MAIIAHGRGRRCPKCGFANSQRSNKCVVCGHGLSKFRNTEIGIDGFVFKSLKEGERYRELRSAMKMGFVTNLEVHPKFDLSANGIKICSYEADFSYFYIGLLEKVVEDVKSKATRTAVYRIKKKLMKAIRGIEIREI